MKLNSVCGGGVASFHPSPPLSDTPSDLYFKFLEYNLFFFLFKSDKQPWQVFNIDTFISFLFSWQFFFFSRMSFRLFWKKCVVVYEVYKFCIIECVCVKMCLCKGLFVLWCIMCEKIVKSLVKSSFTVYEN